MNIKDVAKKAGVSTATVSRALNNPDKVKKETLERVLRVIDENQYTLNPFAQHLASPRRTNNIVMLIPNIVNPFFFELMEGAERVLSEHGYYLHAHNIYQQLTDLTQLSKVIDDLGNEGYFDGLIFTGSLFLNDNFFPELPKISKAVVAIDPNPENQEMDGVLVDERTGIWLALEYLNKKNYKNLGVFHGGYHLELTNRKMNFIKELAPEFKLTLKEEWLYETSFDTLEDSYQIMTKLIKSKKILPQVFLCLNDLMAIAISRAILDQGYRIPEDFAIIGSDDISFSRYMNPALTSIKVPTRDLGKTAAHILLNKMNNPSLPTQRIYLPPTLMVRQSC